MKANRANQGLHHCPATRRGHGTTPTGTHQRNPWFFKSPQHDSRVRLRVQPAKDHQHEYVYPAHCGQLQFQHAIRNKYRLGLLHLHVRNISPSHDWNMLIQTLKSYSHSKSLFQFFHPPYELIKRDWVPVNHAHLHVGVVIKPCLIIHCRRSEHNTISNIWSIVHIVYVGKHIPVMMDSIPEIIVLRCIYCKLFIHHSFKVIKVTTFALSLIASISSKQLM